MPARILLIEDNRASLELMSYLFGAFGHTTLAATDGESGLALIAAERPDLVVCDIDMPGLDGYAIVRRVRANPALHQIPLIAVTALAMLGERERAMSAGYNHYMTKPIDPETFVPEIEQFLPANGGEIRER